MCRVLAYLGHPVLLDELLYQPDNSLVRQTYEPRMIATLNLAGFGMVAWAPDSHRPEEPFTYKAPGLPVFDPNLRNLVKKIRTTCALAHIRGVHFRETEIVSPQNLHPFRFDGFRLALAHNGDLAEFEKMRFSLLEHMRPDIACRIRGTTDSEWIYALLMSQFDDPTSDLDPPAIRAGIESTLRILRSVRERFNIKTMSSMNLFLCDGNNLVATRFAFDYGCYDDAADLTRLDYLSLWYTFGRQYGLHDGEWKMIGGHESADSVIVASEPLTRDVSSWLEVPEYSMVFLTRQRGAARVETVPLDV